jgi:tRNA pseudouridine38-40 synthase
MRNLKLTIAYDGTDYVGWQRQAEGLSVQGVLEDALAPFEGVPVTVHGAGRTDAGVHALGQVANVRVAAPIEPATLARALNAVLPRSVRIVSVEEADPEFHARFSATGKAYEYRIVNAPFVSPFLHRYVWHVPQRLDAGAMRAAADVLRGHHDFAAFQSAGTDVPSSERTITAIDWMSGPGPDSPLVLRVSGDGFLRHMVRNIAGTLVEFGRGRWPVPAMAGILASRDRCQAGTTAPPHGLFLVAVMYHRGSNQPDRCL